MRKLSEERRVVSRRGPDPHRARKVRRRITREERKPEARPHPPGRAAEGTDRTRARPDGSEFEGPDREDRSRSPPLSEDGAASSRR